MRNYNSKYYKSNIANINPGELRTKIIIKKHIKTGTSNNRDIYEWINIYDDNKTVHCKWDNIFGNQIFEANKIGVKSLAIITIRYNPRINETCQIYRRGEDTPYEIISSINDVENRHMWLIFKVGKKVKSK